MDNCFDFLKDVNYQSMDAPLSDKELTEFENMNKMSFPDEYRQFLLTVGNGIEIKIDNETSRYVSGIRRPINKRYDKKLAFDFLFDEAFHERINRYPIPQYEDCADDGTDERCCERCPHLDFCIYSYVEDYDVEDYAIYNGAYYICGAGCTYAYYLIVNGKHRGEVWINNEFLDFAPVKKTFTDFLKWVSIADCI